MKYLLTSIQWLIKKFSWFFINFSITHRINKIFYHDKLIVLKEDEIIEKATFFNYYVMIKKWQKKSQHNQGDF